MCRLYNFLIPHHENESFFNILLRPLGIYWVEEKSESLFQYGEYKKIQSNLSLTNTSKYHNIIYNWLECFIDIDINWNG